MNGKKNFINKILYPNSIIFILVFIIGFGSVITTLVMQINNSAISYISYILSAYALTITIAKIPNIYRKCYQKLDSMKYSHKFIHEEDFRNHLGLYSGFIFNLTYIIYKFVIGIVFKSLLLGASSVYYLLLTGIRYYLIKNVKKKISYEKKVRIYRLIGVVIFVLTIVMAGMSISIVSGKQINAYPGHLIYIVALYTFYTFIVAIINFVKYRHLHNPIFSGVKMISLATAFMSMFILQSSMLGAFGDDEKYRLIMNSITGAVVLILELGISIYMIIKSTIKLKNTKGD